MMSKLKETPFGIGATTRGWQMNNQLTPSELAELESLQQIQMRNPPTSEPWIAASRRFHKILEAKGLGHDARKQPTRVTDGKRCGVVVQKGMTISRVRFDGDKQAVACWNRICRRCSK